MQIRQLRIQNFRGIKKLDWVIDAPFLCLVGCGDATKTTILDAIELVLTPRRSVILDDSDFFDANPKNQIEIEVTVGEVPDRLLDRRKFGDQSRRWKDGVIVDELVEGGEDVLTVRLAADENREPRWAVVNEREPEGKLIYNGDRESLKVSQVGGDADRHLTWRVGSALTKLGDQEVEIGTVLAEAFRSARDAVKNLPLAQMKETAKKAGELALKLGVRPSSELTPGLDSMTFAPGQGGLVLFAGDIPMRRYGLGSRRLLSLALQLGIADTGGVSLIDEVEFGLDPHRLRRLLRELGRRAGGKGQVLLTTHSPISVVDLKARQLRVVRNEGGVTTVVTVPDSLQATLRNSPEAFLAKKVLVCEGKTEMGFCRALDEGWSTQRDLQPFAASGVVATYGEGFNCTDIAESFKALGFKVCLLADSDIDLKKKPEDLRALGIEVLQWPGGKSIEERLALDLSWGKLLQAVALAEERVGSARIKAQVEREFKAQIPGEPATWTASPALREAIGKAAKTGDAKKRNGQPSEAGCWFKNIDSGEALGSLVFADLEVVAPTDSGKTINALRAWVDLND